VAIRARQRRTKPPEARIEGSLPDLNELHTAADRPVIVGHTPVGDIYRNGRGGACPRIHWTVSTPGEVMLRRQVEQTSKRRFPRESNEVVGARSGAVSVRARNSSDLSFGTVTTAYFSPLTIGKKDSKYRSGTAVIATCLAPDSVDAFLGNNRHHHQPRHRISPPPAQPRIQRQADEQDRRQVGAKIGLFGIGGHGSALRFRQQPAASLVPAAA
jgi:hypothetical protein